LGLRLGSTGFQSTGKDKKQKVGKDEQDKVCTASIYRQDRPAAEERPRKNKWRGAVRHGPSQKSRKTSAGTMHDEVQDDLRQMMRGGLADWLDWGS
jgi:hypothetical protein